MLRIDHPDGTAESFTYNALGQILTHTDGKGQTTRLMRNARGLPTRRQDAKGQSIAYEYDKAIRLTALVNENNASYRFAYDASDRLIEEQRIDNLTRRFQYNLGGYLTQVEETGYGERAERPQRHTEFEYEYEANGQLHSRDTGKLVDSEEFRYDAAANRLNFNTSRFDHVKNNRLKQWRDQEYTYDPWGNLVEKRSGLAKWQTFTYDCENRLVKAETLVNSQLHSTGTYQYDSLGRRVAKQSEVNGQTQHKRFLWQGLRMLREEQPGQSSLYIYELGSYAPLARVDQREDNPENTLYYFHTDQIGTPLEMTDTDGQIVWQATYKAWGSLEALTVNEVEQNLRFQGQYFDEETGLHYNTFRYYDPEVGRFVTQDPIGVLGGFNLYSYTLNPFSDIDPWGLCGTKGMGVSKAGHHVPAVRKSVGRPFAVSRSDKTRPTLFPRGENPEHSHWLLHEAERTHVGPRQGSFPGSDDELFDAYRSAYENMDHIKVDVLSPNGTHVLGENVTPKAAVDLIENWLKESGLR
ncbi:RHS repeat-associated core domain-containing protein [Pseudomonas alliivorans]|nr:RHS repeat-associated core domain-containing protein [Pseudomonas alliivorans]